jgi:hypothetical protein
MHIVGPHHHEQLHCCLCAEVQPSPRYGVLLWPTFCSMFHKLAFIGVLGGAKHDTKQLLSCTRRCWLAMLEYERALSLLFQRPVWTSSGIDRMLVQQTDFSLCAVEVRCCYHSLHLPKSSFNAAAMKLVMCVYISLERGCVGGHGDFSSSAVVVTREYVWSCTKSFHKHRQQGTSVQFYTYTHWQ